VPCRKNGSLRGYVARAYRLLSFQYRLGSVGLRSGQSAKLSVRHGIPLVVEGCSYVRPWVEAVAHVLAQTPGTTDSQQPINGSSRLSMALVILPHVVCELTQQMRPGSPISGVPISTPGANQKSPWRMRIHHLINEDGSSQCHAGAVTIGI
jgi:hypothetical protein